ncbi:rho guanine nucleotide exchange factor 5-like, partial [Carcharodon carcharias]|uniref:rho guanine nucleotide exchange factor 5-like n=1 Tax=Carcharodon carcharias TaxID=13397 RepID=UPI001B7EA0A9
MDVMVSSDDVDGLEVAGVPLLDDLCPPAVSPPPPVLEEEPHLSPRPLTPDPTVPLDCPWPQVAPPSEVDRPPSRSGVTSLGIPSDQRPSSPRVEEPLLALPTPPPDLCPRDLVSTPTAPPPAHDDLPPSPPPSSSDLPPAPPDPCGSLPGDPGSGVDGAPHPPPGEANGGLRPASVDQSEAGDLPGAQGKVQVYFLLGILPPDSPLTSPLAVPHKPEAHQEGQALLEGSVSEEKEEEGVRDSPGGEGSPVRLRREGSSRRRSRSAPPLDSQNPSPDTPATACQRRSTGGSSHCQLRLQDALSTEGESEGEEVEAEEEEGAEDEGSSVRGGSGRNPLAKSSSCPSPGCTLGPELQREINAPSGGNQRVEKRPSREWHRRGIRRPSIAFPSSQDSPLDQRAYLESEDLLEMGGSNNLQARLWQRRSKILQSSSLLYQEYSHVTLDREILRQKQEPPAWCETPASQDPVQRRIRGPFTPRTPSTVRASISVPFSLWRDIPEVRKRSEFDSLSQQKQRLQEAKYELITSEASCLRSLDIAVEHFQHAPKLQEVLSNQDSQWLFSRISDVREASRSFLGELEEDLEDDLMEFDVCGILLCHLPAFRAVYIPYVTNQSYQEKTFKRLIQNNPQFREVVEDLESDPVCQRLSLKSFLILPFQRITRLKLLVQ